MACYNVMTLVINNRIQNATKVQEILTDSGCMIKTRLGLHDVGDACSMDGLVILQLAGSKDEIVNLEAALNKIEGVKAKNNEICSEW